MQVHFKPQTNLGKRSAWLIITLAVSLASFRILVISGQRGTGTFFSNPLLAIPMLIAGISGIAAFIIGLISIVGRKERSVSVYLAVALGLVVSIITLHQIISSH